MDDAQRAAFVMAQAALLNAEIAAMTAENQATIAMGSPPPYTLGNFREVIGRYEGILGHNAAINFLLGG